MRRLRAVVATLLVVGLGATAHTLGGGPALQPLPVAVLLVLVAPLVWHVVRARTSVPRMALAVGAGQVVTHVALAAMAPSTGGSAAAAHVHGGVALTSSGQVGPAAAHLSTSMLLAHAVATVVASVLLTRGEDVLRAVVRWLLVELPAAPLSPRPAGTVADTGPRGLVGRAVRPVGGRAPPLHAC